MRGGAYIRAALLRPGSLENETHMGRIFGFAVGIVWLLFAAYAFGRSSAGWSMAASDLGFWWSVVGVLFTLAAGAALVGTWLHTSTRHE